MGRTGDETAAVWEGGGGVAARGRRGIRGVTRGGRRGGVSAATDTGRNLWVRFGSRGLGGEVCCRGGCGSGEVRGSGTGGWRTGSSGAGLMSAEIS